MTLSDLNIFKKKSPLGMDRPEPAMTPEQAGLLREIQARLSGIGEPPQLGNLVTLADIQRAIQTARLGETYFKFALYRDMILNDPHLQAMIGQRVMSFMGQNETIEPFDPNNKDDVIACEFIEDIRENCENWREGCLHLAQGHIWPVAGVEKIYARVEPEDSWKFRHPTSLMLRKLHPIPWPLFTYRVAYWNVNMAGEAPGQGMVPGGNFTNSGAMPIADVTGHTALSNVYGKNANSNLVWNPQDWHPDLRFYNTFPNGMVDWTMATCYKPDKNRHVLHSAQVASSGMRENMAGVLDSLIPVWFYKKNLLDWYMQKMERYGGPFIIAQAQMNNKSVSDALTKAFKDAAKLFALLVPPGTKCEMKEVQVSNMSDGFAKGIDLLNMEETKAICGQTMSTSDKGNGMSGGSGKAELQGEVKEEWSLFDKRAFCEMQTGQIFNPILRLNGYRGRCRSVRGGVSAGQQALLSKTLQSLYLSGIRVRKEEDQRLTNCFGIKLETFDPAAEAADAAAKIDKSKADHANKNKGSIP
jgi:hypothetical protein